MLDPNTDPGLRNQILTYLLSEVLTDRERARLLGLPEGCRIRERAKILAPERLTMGTNVWIGEGAVLDAQGGLTIGDNTQIGLNVMIWTHTSHMQALTGKTGSLSKEGIEYLPTKIGKNCFIAGPSVIGAGVTIGDGVTISPLAMVDSDVAAGEVVSPHLAARRETKRLEKELRELRGDLEALKRLVSTLAGSRKES
jgi:acetyltransferase-like isoleucine patch superfamily enzyme